MPRSSSSCSSYDSSICESNLQRFIHSITLIVVSSSDSQDCDASEQVLRLRDIWESYDGWSACGVGTQVILENGDTVMQYFVPYLSAIQIFYKISSSPTQRENEDEDDGFAIRSSESDELLSDHDDRESSNSSGILMNNNLSFNYSSSSNGSGDSYANYQEDINNSILPPLTDSSDDIYFQFFENCSPYHRIPFVEKITELSRVYPGLMTLELNDISPSSWIAIAWYPIYHIPAKRKAKDLSTCFLTFHTLSHAGAEKSNGLEDFEGGLRNMSMEEKGTMALDPFGIATYKMHENLWNSPATGDEQRLKDLQTAAYSWLQQLNVPHHDFNFFTAAFSPVASS